MGGGRKSLEHTQVDLLEAVERLVEPTEQGDPQSPLRWTCKSVANLVKELRQQGYQVGQTKIRKVLKQLGYSLQANRKTREGKNHPDRDAQFRHIHKRVLAYRRGGRPAISVDTHDFPDKKKGKAIPYGVYDISENEAYVSIGISKDTAEFAIEAIRRWWTELGTTRYRNPKRLFITADCGGSNGYRSRLWKLKLQDLADELGMIIEVCHYPPGTSKWNKIESRGAGILPYHSQLAGSAA